MPNRKAIIEEILNSYYAIRRHMIARYASDAIQDSRISSAQWFILGALEQSEHVAMADVVTQMGVSSSAVTQLVNGMVRKGLVVRKKNPNDRRSVLLTLSTRGMQTVDEMSDKRIRAVSKVFNVLKDAELMQYMKLQQKVKEGLTSSRKT